jgi:hypothetical protein
MSFVDKGDKPPNRLSQGASENGDIINPNAPRFPRRKSSTCGCSKPIDRVDGDDVPPSLVP